MSFWHWKEDKPKEPKYSFRIFRNGHNRFIINRYFMDGMWVRHPGDFDSQEAAQTYIDSWVDRNEKTNNLTLVATITYSE
jgi:hypothetical protein